MAMMNTTSDSLFQPIQPNKVRNEEQDQHEQHTRHEQPESKRNEGSQQPLQHRNAALSSRAQLAFATSASPSSGGTVVKRIRTPAATDVLSGRGGSVNQHPGNIQFRIWVSERKHEYNLAPSKLEKAQICREVIAKVMSQSPPGRFLGREESISRSSNSHGGIAASTGGSGAFWVELDDERTMAKTSQALREGAPRIREEHKTMDTSHTAVKRSASNFVPNATITFTASPAVLPTSSNPSTLATPTTLATLETITPTVEGGKLRSTRSRTRHITSPLSLPRPVVSGLSPVQTSSTEPVISTAPAVSVVPATSVIATSIPPTTFITSTISNIPQQISSSAPLDATLNPPTPVLSYKPQFQVSSPVLSGTTHLEPYQGSISQSSVIPSSSVSLNNAATQSHPKRKSTIYGSSVPTTYSSAGGNTKYTKSSSNFSLPYKSVKTKSYTSKRVRLENDASKVPPNDRDSRSKLTLRSEATRIGETLLTKPVPSTNIGSFQLQAHQQSLQQCEQLSNSTSASYMSLPMPNDVVVVDNDLTPPLTFAKRPQSSVNPEPLSLTSSDPKNSSGLINKDSNGTLTTHELSGPHIMSNFLPRKIGTLQRTHSLALSETGESWSLENLSYDFVNPFENEDYDGLFPIDDDLSNRNSTFEPVDDLFLAHGNLNNLNSQNQQESSHVNQITRSVEEEDQLMTMPPPRIGALRETSSSSNGDFGGLRVLLRNTKNESNTSPIVVGYDENTKIEQHTIDRPNVAHQPFFHQQQKQPHLNIKNKNGLLLLQQVNPNMTQNDDTSIPKSEDHSDIDMTSDSHNDPSPSGANNQDHNEDMVDNIDIWDDTPVSHQPCVVLNNSTLDNTFNTTSGNWNDSVRSGIQDRVDTVGAWWNDADLLLSDMPMPVSP